jgi:hypothetical protein
MDPASIHFKFFAGQATASPFYSNRTDALIELTCSEKIFVQIVEGGLLKEGGGAPSDLVDTRVANIRVPAGHWLVLARDVTEQELELRLRRIREDSQSGASPPPSEIVVNDPVELVGQSTLGLVKNGLTRQMTYRLTVRADKFDSNSKIYVQSGADMIYPASGSFTLDTVVDAGGRLELGSVEGAFTGTYDLWGGA